MIIMARAVIAFACQCPTGNRDLKFISFRLSEGNSPTCSIGNRVMTLQMMLSVD
jgi:hypothetical protein